MNSSRTWKSGEFCRISGTYRCEICHAAGRSVVREFEAGKILPMCDTCPEKDTTWRLLAATPARAANA